MRDIPNSHKRFPVGTLFTNTLGFLFQIVKADTRTDMFTIYDFTTDITEQCSFYVMTINIEDRYWKLYK